MDVAFVFLGCHRRGGVERLVYEAARRFSEDHEVTVYAEEFEEQGLERVRKNKITPSSLPRAMRIAEFSRRVRRDLVKRSHDHVVSFGVASVDADVLWVNSVHRAWLERRDAVAADRLRSSPLRRYLPRHQVMLAMERRYFTSERPSLAFVVSEQVASDIERLYGFPRSKSVVVHNGYDEREFNPELAARDRDAVRAELGVPADAVALLLVANELSRKGLPVLLEAVAELGDPRVHVVLVGRTAPTPYAGRVESLGLTGRFHYGGSRADMARIHGASDLFVLPTRYEAFSLAVVEALASGLPVITTDVPGARDLVVEDVNGLLQREPSSAGELAALLRRALDGERYALWATAASASVRDYTWSGLLDRALTAIQGMH